MNIGEKIREIRNKKNITIIQMCEATALSKGFISSVENNKTSPSISTLQTIANFLEVPLAYLLLEEQDHMTVVRRNKRKLITSKDNNLEIEYLGSKGGLRLLKVELPQGGSIGEPHAHEGIECHLVLQGKVYVEQGENSANLEEGDSFSWNACVPHYVKNIGDGIAIVLISIYTTVEFQDMM